MGVVVAGIIDLETMLARVDMNTKKRITLKMVAKARQIQLLAIKMAPIDKGNLEEAIKMRPENAGRLRNEAGQFGRQEIEVYIDMGMPIPDRPGKTIGDYAYEMHEHQTPMGPIPLGLLSQKKNESNGGVEVGGGFLTRAVKEATGSLMAELALDMFG